MLKYLRIAVTALCLTACVLLVALWVRSYWRADRLHWSFGGKRSFAVASNEGRFLLLGYETAGKPKPNDWKSGWYSHSTTDEQSFPSEVIKNNSRLGFDLLHQPMYFVPDVTIQVPGKPAGWATSWNAGWKQLNGSAVMVPYWFLILIGGTLTVSPWIHWSKRFSLRTLLIATTLVAVGLGLVVLL
jgi:hypothetical protein